MTKPRITFPRKQYYLCKNQQLVRDCRAAYEDAKLLAASNSVDPAVARQHREWVADLNKRVDAELEYTKIEQPAVPWHEALRSFGIRFRG